jgi:hypothetical protein
LNEGIHTSNNGAMPNLSYALVAVATTLHLSAYVIYARKTGRGEATLNTATWILWVFLSALNAASYVLMSGDPMKGAVACAGAVACTVTLAFALAKGRVSAVGLWDGAALGVGILAAAAWLAFRSATYANLILQGGFIVSMIPTYRGILKDARAEPALPWFMWGSAYAVNLCVVVLRWHGHAADLAYPCINLVTHSGVGFAAVALDRARRVAVMKTTVMQSEAEA